MDYVLLISGITILVLVVIDLLYTTLAPVGAGFITTVVSRFIWKVLYYLSGKNGKNKFLNIAGLITMVTVLITWLVLIWTGNTLVFMSDKDSVIHGITMLPATTIEKIYFTGYTLSTLGYGDFAPSTQFWKLYAAAISFSGLILLSIAISYLLPVLNADIEKRKMSILITSMGSSPQQIIVNAWNGKDFSNLNDYLIQLSDSIMKHAQNHLAYPVLHFFHSANPNENGTVSLAALDEALTIFYLYIPEECRPNKYNMDILRKALTNYLNTLSSAFIQAADEVPEKPDLELLKQNNIPVININDQTDEAYGRIEERRKLLLGLLKDDGWDWSVFEENYYTDKLTLK